MYDYVIIALFIFFVCFNMGNVVNFLQGKTFSDIVNNKSGYVRTRTLKKFKPGSKGYRAQGITMLVIYAGMIAFVIYKIYNIVSINTH